MASVNNIIEPEYRVNVYLDTNILVDYIEGKFPLLKRSIDFLVNCPYVNLRSSHYVLFEFTEVRKVNLFWEKSDPAKSEDYKKVKSTIKKEWKYNGRDYNEFKSDIINQVGTEVEFFKSQLQIDFNEHVLHEGLIYPANSLCLATKISREDCLVMVSCMHPTEESKLDHCILLSRDEQYYKAYNENKEDADKVFGTSNLNNPSLIRTENLHIGEHGTLYNLYDSNGRTDIENYWVALIKETLRSNLQDRYVGTTYLYGKKGVAAQCLYFDMDGAEKTLIDSDGLYFVYNDLSSKAIIPGPFEYWNYGKRINLPNTNTDYPKYSFKPEAMSAELLQKLREAGHLVFYYNL